MKKTVEKSLVFTDEVRADVRAIVPRARARARAAVLEAQTGRAFVIAVGVVRGASFTEVFSAGGGRGADPSVRVFEVVHVAPNTNLGRRAVGRSGAFLLASVVARGAFADGAHAPQVRGARTGDARVAKGRAKAGVAGVVFAIGGRGASFEVAPRRILDFFGADRLVFSGTRGAGEQAAGRIVDAVPDGRARRSIDRAVAIVVEPVADFARLALANAFDAE